MESKRAGFDRRFGARPVGEFSVCEHAWKTTLQTARAFPMSHRKSFFINRIMLSILSLLSHLRGYRKLCGMTTGRPERNGWFRRASRQIPMSRRHKPSSINSTHAASRIGVPKLLGDLRGYPLIRACHQRGLPHLQGYFVEWSSLLSLTSATSSFWQRLNQTQNSVANRFQVEIGCQGFSIEGLSQLIHPEKGTRQPWVKNLAKKLVRRLGTGAG